MVILSLCFESPQKQTSQRLAELTLRARGHWLVEVGETPISIDSGAAGFSSVDRNEACWDYQCHCV